MNRAIAILFGTLLVGGLALGQALPNPFDVGLGVRAMGLGGAYTALAEGTEALLYNPAGLATLPGPRADSSYSSPMGLYSVTWLAGAFPGIGGGVAYLSAGSITDPATGSPLTFSHLALVAGVGMSANRVPMLNRYLRLPFPLTLGLSIKYDRVQMATETGGNLAFDIGALTRMDIPFGELRLGLAVRDLGPGIGLGERRESWSTSFAVGAALLLPGGLLFTTDLASDYLGMGVGWAFGRGLEVRSGFQSQGGIVHLALGLGVRWKSFALDYALTTHPTLGPSHRLSLGILLGG